MDTRRESWSRSLANTTLWSSRIDELISRYAVLVILRRFDIWLIDSSLTLATMVLATANSVSPVIGATLGPGLDVGTTGKISSKLRLKKSSNDIWPKSGSSEVAQTCGTKEVIKMSYKKLN